MLEYGTKESTSRSSNSLSNVFISQAKIIDLETIKSKADIGIKVTLELQNKDKWKKPLYLHGKFERDDKDNVVGFGSTKKIARLLEKSNVDKDLINKLDVNGILPCFPEALNSFITVITYKTTNDKYYNVYPLVESKDKDKVLMKTFEDIWNKTKLTDRPYPNDFIGFNKEFIDSSQNPAAHSNGMPTASNERESNPPPF